MNMSIVVLRAAASAALMLVAAVCVLRQHELTSPWDANILPRQLSTDTAAAAAAAAAATLHPISSANSGAATPHTSWRQQSVSALLVPPPPANRTAALAALHAQTQGKWTASSTCARSLLPKERERVDGSSTVGQYSPDCTPDTEASKDFARALVSTLGHQCGCNAGAPTALHEWQVREEREDSCARTSEASNVYASLDLIRELRGRTTCFVGDSVTLQLYDALKHNLHRLAMLRPELDLVVRDSKSDEVPFVNSTDASRGVVRWWWGGLKKVEGFVVTSSGAPNAQRSHSHNVAAAVTNIRWYKHYVWSPWDAELIASDCDIVLYNIALHYDAAAADLKGRNLHPYRTDLRGAMTWLANFSESPGKTAIWRESLPQHFRTVDGVYSIGGSGTEPGCVKRGTAVPGDLGTSVKWPKQRYNNVTAAIWEELCGPPAAMGMSHRCNAAALMRRDESGEFGESLLQWWRTNNYTAQLEHYAATTTKKKNKLKTTENEDEKVVGEVWEWKVFDLFDEAYEFHSSLGDCTHFCFVPELFNAAFETLRRVLAVADLKN